MERFDSVKQDTESFLEQIRAERLAVLVPQHDAAVVAERQAKKAFGAARDAEFEALIRTGLDEKAKMARKELEAAQHALKKVNRSLMTSAELKTLVAHIETLKTDETSGLALNKYHALLAKTGEAGDVHLRAMQVAGQLSAQIDSL
jgi:hypothetical protein